jgi:hypothetical protein
MHVDPSAPNAAVTGAIRQAARMTGTDFQYLVATAQVESNLNPNARVATSSARGLFQFIEQTWLQTLKQQGPALGYGSYADAITRLPSGKYVVTEPRLRGAIMNMRSDPTASAIMAGAFTRANAARLAGTLGRAPAGGELYIAHFLGPTGASRLIGLAQSRPTTPAAAAFPAAAKANRTIFYDRTGRARSAGEVYHALVGRYEIARARQSNPTMVAAGGPFPAKESPVRLPELAAISAKSADSTALAARGTSAAAVPRQASAHRPAVLDSVALVDTYPNDRTPTPAVADKNVPMRRPAPAALDLANAQTAVRAPSPAERAREAASIFHGLFRTAGASEPVAPLVSALWTAPTPAPPSRPGVGQRAPVDPASGALDLFQERPPAARTLFRGRV